MSETHPSRHQLELALRAREEDNGDGGARSDFAMAQKRRADPA